MEMITTRHGKIEKIVDYLEKARIRKQKRMQQIETLNSWEKLKAMGSVKCRDFPHYTYPSHRALCDLFHNDNWAGDRCFIVGGGPSLIGFDFSQLDCERTIAVNRAFEYFDPSIAFFMDNDTFYKKVMDGKFGGHTKERFIAHKMKVTLNIACSQYEHGVYSVPISERPQMTTDLKDGLFEGGNSGFAALNLAVCLGASPIYLLGFDMKTNGSGKQSWFHAGYENPGKDSVYRGWIECFNDAAPTIKELGIDVINLNPDSGVRCFEFNKFERIVQ